MVKIDTFAYDNEENYLFYENVTYRRNGKVEVARLKENDYKVIEENENFVIMKREATKEHNCVSLVIISSFNY